MNIIGNWFNYLRSSVFKPRTEIKIINVDWILNAYPVQKRELIASTSDPIRYGTILLALEDIIKNNVPGLMAECGVYQGYTSKFIHNIIPDRRFYLFDTFEGFHTNDLDSEKDDRFRDTSVDFVKNHIGKSENIIFKQGYFPETTIGLEAEKFAFVMIDFDKYKPTLAALEFFYPRVGTGGYIFIHDYNNPESDWACTRALDLFLKDKPEKHIAIPDCWGTALFKKI
jgi:O-methyltransferase